VFILQDVREARHPIGTARIATLSLRHAEMVPLDPDNPDPSADFLDTLFSRPLMHPALVYPGDNAVSIDDLETGGAWADRPRDLLFIDASWGRSVRMMKVFPALGTLPQVALRGLPTSRYRIRKQPSADAVSTLEAIAYVLQHVEPALDCQPMLATMDWVIDQQIKRMGRDVYRRNYPPE
tara:strand:- start:7519 stop:8058 length:540 start_codon:yes stop_codon:yes gene_type:complete